ncbi:MAG: TIGR01212 family radical SAM protein [Lachnospiraceae bacterium]|nr:TIGR01212 family radical SAM protein [Lachnospiraceae bacterium]
MLLNEYLRHKYGCKVYKLALNGGFTCPNRDGTIDTRGCIFCSEGGSGEFTPDPRLSITEQIERAKEKVAKKIANGKYIAYFQAFTGTYAPVERLKTLYTEAINHPDVVALSIATRPDCLPDEVLDLLSECNTIKPIWVELGLQTVHEKSARYIRRGYELPIYSEAVKKLRSLNIEVITHVIIGLPGEAKEDILDTVRYVCESGATGIKLQLLHILKGTDLEKEYREGKLRILSEDEYIDILKECVNVIPDNIVIHRLTGDGDKKLLVAPLWSADKKHVWNRIQKEVLYHI